MVTSHAHPAPVGTRDLDRDRPARPLAVLTERQQQTLICASLGMTEAQTAVELGISRQTVKDHRRQVMRKLNTRSMGHAVAVAFQKGLLR